MLRYPKHQPTAFPGCGTQGVGVEVRRDKLDIVELRHALQELGSAAAPQGLPIGANDQPKRGLASGLLEACDRRLTELFFGQDDYSPGGARHQLVQEFASREVGGGQAQLPRNLDECPGLTERFADDQ